MELGCSTETHIRLYAERKNWAGLNVTGAPDFSVEVFVSTLLKQAWILSSIQVLFSRHIHALQFPLVAKTG